MIARSILNFIVIVGGTWLFRALLPDSPQGVPIIIAMLLYIGFVLDLDRYTPRKKP